MTAPAPNWTHSASVLRVVDGDTLLVSLDLGKYPHKVRVEAPIRIIGLWAPELRAEGGAEAAGYLVGLLRDAPGMGYVDVIVTTRKPDPRDAFGRILADVYLPDGRSVAEVIIAAGHGTAAR